MNRPRKVKGQRYTCPECGEPFVARRFDQVTCGFPKSCQYDRRRRLDRERAPRDRNHATANAFENARSVEELARERRLASLPAHNVAEAERVLSDLARQPVQSGAGCVLTKPLRW